MMNMEEKIREFFELNYEMMRYEAGHDITADVRNLALNQALLYWKKLKHIAERVTETEIKLALPDQTSPEGRRFTIEGVVDIIREENETWMYDIKTHDGDYIINNLDLFEKQLNIYAHIWKGLRGNPLDHTAIIATAIPSPLRDALHKGDEKFIAHEMEKWQPVFDIALNQKHIDELIENFGEVVDCIENNKFQPPPLNKLKERAGGKNSKENFGTRVCRNCDARFSCSSYRQYAAQSQGKNLYNFKQFWIDATNDDEQEEWMLANTNNEQINNAADAADQLN